MGTITIRYCENKKDYKIDTQTLSILIRNALEQGEIYPEKLGRDRLETLIIEQ